MGFPKRFFCVSTLTIAIILSLYTLSFAGDTIIADHRAAAAFDKIPAQYIKKAKSQFRIFYGHTSHGSQIMTGLKMLRGSVYTYNSGSGSLNIKENGDQDLGSEGDLDWVDTTRGELRRAGGKINMVMWSWCGGVSYSSAKDMDTYLNAMAKLEAEYPKVTFVYMTGHLSKDDARTLKANNKRIRKFCKSKGKVLFDFADIESYDPAGKYFSNASDACEWCRSWCKTHSCPKCRDCAHSHCFNCYLKGKAFWWMMAKLAGWR